ncbi:cytochrome c oxidase assembly protein [Massilia solisilvae]|uniref:Cytochrome c oxidase assembly protein n=1 Tax=Massilia solisilvae TaxID=1811225 RepID=A0ABT2BE38_9BURK|nr:cytochrome c oxidase assembly protein [Massilia solisilvae]MCS0606652.1 cytochrome c oxidase assembly protein [Massilia solisilvae]
MGIVAMRHWLTLPLPWLAAASAFAHDVEEEHATGETLGWGAEWWVLALLALSLMLHVVGARRLWLRMSRSRHRFARQAACFACGWLVLALALASPIDGAGSLAFSAHMVQHELLMIVAAPLMVLGRPLGVWVWALPSSLRTGVRPVTHARAVVLFWDVITRPVNAWILHFAALWMWHVPGFFQAALRNNGIHALQHASFLFSALLFWWAVLGKQVGSGARGHAMISLFSTMMHTGALGALFTFSESVWYPAYGDSAWHAFGLSAVEDQQLGGLIMWIPGGLAYVAAGLALMAGWLAVRRPTMLMGADR